MKRLTLILAPAYMFLLFACQKETSLETGINTPATGTLKDTLGDCDSISVNGIYTEGNPLTAANTVAVTVTVTTPGTYRIETDIVNGMYFVDSGFFSSTGIYTVMLKGKGTPQVATASNFTVNFGLSFCDFPIDVIPATTSGSLNDADTAWMFNDASAHFQGHIDSALFKTSNGITYLNIYGKPSGNDTTVYIQLQMNTANPSGAYATSSGTAVFEFKTAAGATIYESHQADNTNLVFTVTSFDASAKIMEAVFSGTAKDAAGTIKNITGGKLKLQVQ